MNAIKQLNLLVSFLLELAMLFFYSYWAYRTSDTDAMRYTLAVVMPAIAVVIWAIWAAPKSKYRLANPFRSVLKVSLCLLAAFLCYKTGQGGWAVWFTAVVLLNAGVAFALGQDY